MGILLSVKKVRVLSCDPSISLDAWISIIIGNHIRDRNEEFAIHSLASGSVYSVQLWGLVLAQKSYHTCSRSLTSVTVSTLG